MNTKDIEEIIHDLKRKHPCIVTDKMAIGGQSELYTDVFDSFGKALTTLTQHHEAEVERAKWNIGAWIEEQDFARKEAERSGDANAVWAIQDVIKQINQHLKAPTKMDYIRGNH